MSHIPTNKSIAYVCVCLSVCVQLIQGLISLKCPQRTYITYKWAKSPNTRPLYYKMLRISCNLTNAAACPQNTAYLLPFMIKPLAGPVAHYCPPVFVAEFWDACY